MCPLYLVVENMSHFITGRKYVYFFIGQKSVRRKSVRRKSVRRKNVPVPKLGQVRLYFLICCINSPKNSALTRLPVHR